MFENDSTFKCLKHNSPFTIVVTEQNFRSEDRLQCANCWNSNQTGLHTIPFLTFVERIKEQQNSFCQNLNMIILKNLSIIDQLKVSINSIKTQLNQKLTNCEEKISLWNAQLIELGDKNSKYSIHSEVDRFIQNESKMDYLLELTRTIKELNYDYSNKIQLQLNHLMDSTNYLNCQQSLLDVNQMDSVDIIESCPLIQSNIQNDARKKPFCQVHNQEIIYVDSDKDVDIELRTSCLKCNRRNGDNLDDFLRKWEHYSQEGKRQLRDQFQKLKFQVKRQNNELISIRTEICQIIDQKIKQNNEMLKTSYDKQFQSIQEFNYQLNHQRLKESALKLSKQESVVNCVQNQNEDYCILTSKINHILHKLDQAQKMTLQDFKAIKLEEISSDPQNNNSKEDADQSCFAVAFNKSDQIMISGSGSSIKAWLFNEGQLVEIEKFEAHDDNISCLVFSQHSNSFISGSMDFTIKIWKEKSQFKWESSQAYLEHTDFISCLILSQNEDFLFSGSYDRTIRIWKLDFGLKSLQQVQCLEKHTNLVFGLSINSSQSQLVSCGQDQQILLWEKGNGNQWNFKQKVQQSIQDFGFRIQFISDTQFVWSSKGIKGCLCFFELENGLFIEKQEKQINLGEDDCEDKDFFPIYYNTQRNVVAIKHKRSIYTFKKEQDNNITLLTNIQIFENPEFYGQLTNDGNYMVAISKVQNKNVSQFIIKKLHYY
ncbi:unnamed protein product (macronuclear) [Paramecium tetraurelia]|uniref:Uncharacterized protein n=1 Tax=Paramecium tetraurelia TaxID=5888 RepID=A0EG97_PARTE|nr:uncharacterized protein GSPATT00026662001 [Paramecium tetraurelia]CAK94338.1 unnamed protein product [Paramecium tetraurelia]|eukprot:XP_001461711.1 hypothetical protein (macronuclear) [Paramecium tetraurelia strain d4-2]